MRLTRAPSILFALVAHAGLAACDDPARPAPPPSPPPTRAVRSPSAAASSEPAPEGCARTGALEGIESDPTCILARVADDAMRELSKRLRVELTADAPVVAAGSETLLRLRITNVTQAEVLVVLDALPRAPGPRPDWSRLSGVPDARPQQAEATPRLHWSVITTDAWDRDVDGMPTVPGSATAPTAPRLVGVRLRPGGKLTHALPWFAVRIPPPPLVKEVSGRRFLPTTAAIPLPVGEYTASLEVPLHGLAPAERSFSVKLRVEAGAPEPKKHKP